MDATTAGGRLGGRVSGGDVTGGTETGFSGGTAPDRVVPGATVVGTGLVVAWGDGDPPTFGRPVVGVEPAPPAA
jgi:hypothetical protein